MNNLWLCRSKEIGNPRVGGGLRGFSKLGHPSTNPRVGGWSKGFSPSLDIPAPPDKLNLFCQLKRPPPIILRYETSFVLYTLGRPPPLVGLLPSFLPSFRP